jgi:hypothetical protein
MRLNSLLLLLILMPSLIVFINVASAADERPISEGAASIPNEKPEGQSELVLRIGNESNPVDGFFGPFTYGGRGNHKFENEYAVEAGYVRLHEPGALTFASVVDEAQLTLRFPERHSYFVAATAWQNRMIDMYTNLIGLEVNRKGPISVMAGAYVGTASREEVTGNFRGGQIAISSPIGSVGLTAAALVGKIDDGSYRKLGLEASMDFATNERVPFTLSLATEDRYFAFGNGGPVSDPRDDFIFVTALEFHFEKLVAKAK